ncbi:cytochrome c [Burkholderia gladioli]|uniref:cytochrome c n=1 Tax=Burkholderia gladioli TaxID=28095 RepID=UPI00164212F9|nr:cytochrome c [Burkholderia gladioli]URV25753.1 c-type cytochrome [Burkholderia gladioli]
MSRKKHTLPSAGPASSRPPGGRFKRVIAWAAAVLIVGMGAFAAFAWQPAISEVPTPAPSSFSPALIQQGARLAAAGFCASCHTVAGGAPFAGGYAMKTGFGTIYSTNISPDRETGIGTWSEAAFLRAMHEGVARDGSHLFPAFPYDHFTKLSDADVDALYAYVMTRPPVHAENHPDEMPFPLGIRAFQAGWKLLFFHPGRFEARADQSRLWNRGAYLAESLSHCSACHTPRGPLGEELTSRLYQGAAVDGWFAPALTAANPTPVPWTSAELYDYLTTGVSRYHGPAAGPMAPVTHALAALDADDQRALVTYVESLGAGDQRAGQVAPAVAAALAADAQDHQQIGNQGGRLFVSACASCHYNRAPDVNPNRPELGLNSSVFLDDPSNLIRVILYGISTKEGAGGVVMPGFAKGMSDEDVASIAGYLRSTRTNKALWPDLAKRVASIRAAGPGEIQ